MPPFDTTFLGRRTTIFVLLSRALTKRNGLRDGRRLPHHIGNSILCLAAHPFVLVLWQQRFAATLPLLVDASNSEC